MAVNKVVLKNKETLIDLSGDTLTENVVLKGYTGHNSKGEPFTGNVVVKPEQSKSFEATANGSFTVSPDSGKTLSSVAVKVNVTNADTVDGYHIQVGSSVTAKTGYLSFKG